MKILILSLLITVANAVNAELINPTYTPEPIPHDFGPYESKTHTSSAIKKSSIAENWTYIYEAGANEPILKGGTGNIWEFDDSFYIATIALRVKASIPTTVTCAILVGPEYLPTKQVKKGTRTNWWWQTVNNYPLTPGRNVSIGDANYQMTVTNHFPIAFNGTDGEVKVELPNMKVKADTRGSFKLVCKSDNPVTVIGGGYLKVKQDKFHQDWTKAATLTPLDPGSYVISNSPYPGAGISGDSWEDVVNNTYNTGYAIIAKLCEVKNLRFSDASTDDWGRARYYADLIIATRSTAQANKGVPLDCASSSKITKLGRLYLQSCVGTVENGFCKVDTPVCPVGWDFVGGVPLPALCTRVPGTST